MNEIYNLLCEVEHHYQFAVGFIMEQGKTTLIKRLSPPALAKSEREVYLAKCAAARKITQFDVAIAIVILLDFALTYLDSVTRRWYVGTIDILLLAILVTLLIFGRNMRPLLGRLMLVGLVAGIGELFTDASGQQIVHSLMYPAGELTIWTSPLYMPLSWLITLTYLGYISWRLRALLGWRMAVMLCALLGALDIPFFEEISYYGGWWRYAPTHLMLGHTPAYVALFEGLIVAALPVFYDRLERRSWVETVVIGAVIGVWMAFAALAAWLLLGR